MERVLCNMVHVYTVLTLTIHPFILHCPMSVVKWNQSFNHMDIWKCRSLQLHLYIAPLANGAIATGGTDGHVHYTPIPEKAQTGLKQCPGVLCEHLMYIVPSYHVNASSTNPVLWSLFRFGEKRLLKFGLHLLEAWLFLLDVHYHWI